MVSPSDELTTGDGLEITVEEVAKIYRECHSKALPSSGKIERLDATNFSITCGSSALDCDTLENIKTFKIYSLTVTKSTDQRSHEIKSLRLLSDQQFADPNSVTSDYGGFLARLKSRSPTGVNQQQLLEIWKDDEHLRTVNISDLEVHGPIEVGSMFSSFRWCPHPLGWILSGSMRKLLYTCRRKQPKKLSFFETRKLRAGEATSSQSVKLGLEFEHKEDWGECSTGIDHMIAGIIDVCDYMTAEDYPITTIDVEGFTLSDSRWLDNGNKIVSVAYSEEPRRLGPIYCNNRVSRILVHDLTQSPPKLVIQLADETMCFHSPRVDHSGYRFVYLTNKAYGAHFQSVQLCLYDIRSNERRLILDKLQTTDDTKDLFIESLPDNCFSVCDRFLLFENLEQLTNSTYILNLGNLRWDRLGNNLKVLDFNHNIVLFSKSSVDKLPSLGVCVMEDYFSNNSDDNRIDHVKFHGLESADTIRGICYEQNFCIKNERNSMIGSALLVCPKAELPTDYDDLPTIVSVHGGPHMAYSSYYQQLWTFFAQLGFKMLMINYRGSTGLTEDFAQSLCGEAGIVDVNDCLAIIRHYVKQKKINPEKLIIRGGSHGGFLACHLSSQEEIRFTSAVILNPVVSIPLMYATTDIPDWVGTEFLNHKRFDSDWVPDYKDLVRMHQRSPNPRKANVPTIMFLGNQDQRVRMFGGMRWIEQLKARGIETKCKVYPDNHSLTKPEVSADAAIESVIWMMRHLPNDQSSPEDE